MARMHTAADGCPWRGRRGPDADAHLVLAHVSRLATRVADGHRAAVGELHGVGEHLLQLLSARRREHPHPGHPGEQRHVDDAVVAQVCRDR